MESVKTFLAENFDKKIVFSALIAAGLFGIAMYAGSRSGIKPLVAAADAMKGGK